MCIIIYYIINSLQPYTPKLEVSKIQCKFCLKPIDKSQEQQHLALDCPVAAKITCSICHTTMAKYLIPNHYKQKHPEHPIPNNTTTTTQPGIIPVNDPTQVTAESKPVNHLSVQIPITQQKSDSPYKQLDIINQVLDQSEEYESAEDEGDSSQIYTQEYKLLYFNILIVSLPFYLMMKLYIFIYIYIYILIIDLSNM